MSVQMSQVSFDEPLAQSYLPHRVVKQAVLIPAPDGVESVINAEWGEIQRFIGPWYAIYINGNVTYGSARQEFEETHGTTNEVENGYFKNTPIRAYQYHGPEACVTTILASGVIETENTISDTDWLAQWPHGEVGVLKDHNFRSRYQVD